jgi:hypothetical protein
MNNILNKIAQMERNAEEIQLASHHVELGLADTFKTNVNVDNKNIAKLDSQIEKINAELKNLSDLFSAANKGIMTTSNVYDRMVEMAKELGLPQSEIDKMPEVKQYEKNAVQLTEVLKFINKHR